MPGIVLGAGKTAVNKTGEVSALLGFTTEWKIWQLKKVLAFKLVNISFVCTIFPWFYSL